MKKNYFLKGVAAVALGVAAVGCSHDAYVPTPQDEVIKNYEAMFVKTFGQPSGNQDWGFGAGTRAANDAWSETHTDEWMSLLNFTKPANAVEITDANYNSLLSNGRIPDGTYYIGKAFTGTVNFRDGFVGDVYVDTEITRYWGNIGTMNLYILEDGVWKCDLQPGSTTIYNKGMLALGPWGLQTASYVPVIYNGGHFTLGNGSSSPNIADAVKLYSTGTAITEILTNGSADLKFACDIHGTLKVNGDLKIQNDKEQHICGLEVDGHLEMAQGNLRTSHVKANTIKFDGASIWLLKEGYIEATEKIEMPNSASHVLGYDGSHGVVMTKDFYLQNGNFFGSVAFSSNIYFNITGRVNATNCSVLNGDWASIEDYFADGREPEVKNRVNVEISGAPECGLPYGTPKEEDWKFQCRIFAEDLSAETGTDFDFNDVVFDVLEKGDSTKIVLLAAGGTLPLYVAGEEVHAKFGENTTTMINTGAGPNHDPVDFNIAKTDYRDIKIYVKKPNIAEPIELTATKGKPAGKFAVLDEDVDWQDEFKNINGKYPKFNDWVEGNAEYFYK